MSVEVNLQDLIKHKKQQMEQLNADIQQMTARRDSILNLVVELESLFTQDDQADQESEEFRLGGSEGPVIPWSDSSASIHKEAMPKGERFEHVVPRKGRPIQDRPQA